MTAASKTANKNATNSKGNRRGLHLKAHQFKPGQSGNPRGRPKKVVDVEKLALDSAEEAIKKLQTLMKSQDERVALQAAGLLLDRAVGKAKQQVALEKTVKHEKDRLSDHELEDIAAGSSAGTPFQEEVAQEPDRVH